ncbi:hypothetical protein M3Y99_00455500 [Aphelenchoides fujianensis]|nr:hypothetical protein M3Y99_00455500 [Aphelenchoides fujianensis]
MKKQTNDGVDAPQTTQFDGGVTPELHHKARILLSVMEAGYRPPTPLQEAVVQAIGSGESFLIEKEAADGEAAGRTLAIAVGILQRVDEAADRLQALILTPSRQSAKHMTEALQKVGARSAVRVHSCVGGALSVDDERRLLADGRVQVVVGLPGRVNVLLAREALVVDHVRALVFHRSDEAAWQTLQQQTAEILRRLPAGLQIVSDGGRRGNFCFDWIADRLPAPRRIVAKNSDGVYALGAFVEEKEEEKRDEAGAAPSTSAPQQKEDLDFSLVSNWGHYSATLLHPHMSDTTVGILMGKRYEMARPHSLQERLLQPAIDGKDVVGISPPGRGTSLAVSLLVNERVDRFVPGLQVLVLKPKPRKDVEIENYTACICELNGVEIGGCACATDDECDHPHGHQQVLVHSPTASCRTTIAERCMESDALRMVVVHRVDELLAADRPKIFAILRAKPPRVQLVITAAEMTADVLRIARDFMPPRSVNGEPSPVLLSVTKEDLQVVTYSLVGGRLKTKVHVDALRFDQIVGEANTRHVVELLRVRTEVPEPLAETPGDPQPPVSANSVEDPSDPGNQLLKPEQKASLNACLGEGHNLLLRGPPGTGKSTTAAIVVLKAVHSVAGPHAVILVPSVERTQKFKSLLDALGTKLKPSIYVCEEHPKIAADFPPPAIVIGKPRQVRELIGRGLIRPAELKVVVFAQVHKMLGAAYREDPHEVLRALPVFVQVLATSNSGDAAVVQEIDEFFNANCCVRAARMDATKAAAPVANVHFGPAFSATAHRALLDVVERLPEFRAAQPKSTGQAASGERTAKKPRKAEANAKAAKRNGPKNEKKAADRARGAGKTTAVMIALLNQLDAENEKLQAICMTQSGKEVVRLRNQMDGLAAQMQLVVRACPDDQSAAQARALFDSKLHVLIGTGEQLHALLQRTLLISSLPSVHHFVVFELGAANTTAAFLWEIPTFHCCLRMVPVLQTVLVAERVTDEVLDLCNRLEVDFLLISTVEAKEEAGEKSRESRSGPKEDGRQTEKSDKPPDDVVLDVDSVRPELPPTAPTVEEHQPAVAIAASVPIASAASSTRGSGRSTPIFRYSFLEFNLRPELHAAVKRMGIRTTLSVQRRTIPPLLAGRNAVVRAPAGLGTLGVFLLPLLQRLEPAVGRVQAIVVCQKRSTAAEVEDALLNGYGQCLRFKTRVCLGGELVAEQLQAIAAGVHVVVGVAQRVCAIVESVQFDAQSLRFVVFDELDEQLRTGREMVHAVLRRLAADVQLVFVQREESPWVDETVRKFLADPLRVVGMDEAKAADRKKEGELKAPSNSRLPAGKEEPKEGPSKPKKKSSDESTASSTSSSSERTLVEIDSRQTTARVDTEEEDKEPEEPPEEKTIPVFSEDEEEDEKRDGESPTEAADLAHIQAPTDLLASRLAAAQLRGQLLKNRLKELRIYALEKKLGLAHGQPVDVLPPN